MSAYIIIGGLWGAWAFIEQRRDFGSGWPACLLIAVINAAIWPLSALFAVWWYLDAILSPSRRK